MAFMGVTFDQSNMDDGIEGDVVAKPKTAFSHPQPIVDVPDESRKHRHKRHESSDKAAGASSGDGDAKEKRSKKHTGDDEEEDGGGGGGERRKSSKSKKSSSQKNEAVMLYSMLDIPPTATKEQVKKAYSKRCKGLDGENNPEDAKKLKYLKKALTILTDDEKRKEYDEKGDAYLREKKNKHGDQPTAVATPLDDRDMDRTKGKRSKRQPHESDDDNHNEAGESGAITVVAAAASSSDDATRRPPVRPTPVKRSTSEVFLDDLLCCLTWCDKFMAPQADVRDMNRGAERPKIQQVTLTQEQKDRENQIRQKGVVEYRERQKQEQEIRRNLTWKDRCILFWCYTCNT
eukprot:c8697_g1_i4.p1 GENE.c8697_g1_i4~~c8697_g1_i4.p1  ORF type:complete len:346 (+),score=100.52 c8697_g1_i4:35-1072(+)